MPLDEDAIRELISAEMKKDKDGETMLNSKSVNLIAMAIISILSFGGAKIGSTSNEVAISDSVSNKIVARVTDNFRDMTTDLISVHADTKHDKAASGPDLDSEQEERIKGDYDLRLMLFEQKREVNELSEDMETLLEQMKVVISKL